jgi:AcrR family transcriptional regulator
MASAESKAAGADRAVSHADSPLSFIQKIIWHRNKKRHKKIVAAAAHLGAAVSQGELSHPESCACQTTDKFPILSPMHTTPARILRTYADSQPNARRYQPAKEREMEDHILRAARPVLARNGRIYTSIAGLAFAIRVSPATLRRHFPDLDALLGELLHRHLRAISDELGKIPQGTLNCHAARRAAYLAVTRTPYGGPTDAHILLLRDRHALPPDLAESIEAMRQSIGDLLAYPNGPLALAMLDTPCTDPTQIETMFAALTPASAPKEEPAPAPLPTASPPLNRASLTGTTSLARPAAIPIPATFTPRPSLKFPARAGPAV